MLPPQLGRLVAGLEPGLDLAEHGIQAALRRPIRRESVPWDSECRDWLRKLEAAVIALGFYGQAAWIRGRHHSSGPAADRRPRQPGGVPPAGPCRGRGPEPEPF